MKLPTELRFMSRDSSNVPSMMFLTRTGLRPERLWFTPWSSN